MAFSHLALRDDQLPHQDRRRPLRVPFGTPRPTTCTSRPVRHDAVGVSFAIHRQVLLPAFHYHFRHELQNPRATRDHGLRANQTTAHDETSRARRHEGRTAPYQGTARRLHRLARTADMRPCSLLLRVFSTLVIESLESHEFRIGNLSVTPKVTSYYSHTKTSARYVS